MPESSTLSNGIVVLSDHVPQANGVGISVVVDAGPQDEKQGDFGLAHLCEHSLFLGTRNRNEREIASIIDSAGGQLGGFTTRDYTCLHATISADCVTYAIDLLGDMVTGTAPTQDRICREIDVIGHEIERHHDQADVWLDARLKQVMWRGDRLGGSILGTRDSLASLDATSVSGFIQEHYASDRLIVAGAGPITHDEFAEQVNDAFWSLTPSAAQRTRTPAVPVGGVVVEPREQKGTLVSLMIPIPVYNDPNRYALHVMNAVLGCGMSSRLYTQLRDRLGHVYSVNSSINAYARGGVLAIEFATNPEHAIQCIIESVEQLIRLASGDAITEEELWQAKLQVRGQAYLASDSIPTRVGRLATQQIYLGSPLGVPRLLEDIDAVDMVSLSQVARDIVGPGLGSLSIGIAGRIPGSEDQAREELAALRDCFAEMATESA
ncbi:MAG: pitrilysin family protein [Planctomycetota bacterium]